MLTNRRMTERERYLQAQAHQQKLDEEAKWEEEQAIVGNLGVAGNTMRGHFPTLDETEGNYE